MTKIEKKIFKIIALSLLLAWSTVGFEPSGAGAQQGSDLNSRIYQVQQSGVQADVLNRLLSACHTHRVPAESIRGFLDILESAGRERLPARPLVDKVQEGLSKNVPARSIQKALDRMVDEYRMLTNLAASSSVSGHLTSDIMVRLNQSLYIGLTQKELKRLIRQAQNASWHDLAAAAEFRAALKQYRFDPSLAEKITVAGLKAGFFRNNAWDLLDLVSRARRQKLTDQKITTILLEFVYGRQSYQQTMQRLNEPDTVGGRAAGQQNDRKGSGAGQGPGGSGGDSGGSGEGGGGDGNGGGGNGGGDGGGKGR